MSVLAAVNVDQFPLISHPSQTTHVEFLTTKRSPLVSKNSAIHVTRAFLLTNTRPTVLTCYSNESVLR